MRCSTSRADGPADRPGQHRRRHRPLKATREVQHLLLAQAATRDGIVVDDQQVDAELAKPEIAQQLQDGELVFDPVSARQATRDQLIAEALTTKYWIGWP